MKHFEQSRGLDTALYKNLPFTYISIYILSCMTYLLLTIILIDIYI